MACCPISNNILAHKLGKKQQNTNLKKKNQKAPKAINVWKQTANRKQ